jgi:hypothetical protein
MFSKKEIYYPDHLEQGEKGYSFDRVLNEVCKGNEKLAEAVWSLCEWQFPETLIDEYLREEELVEHPENADRYLFLLDEGQKNEYQMLLEDYVCEYEDGTADFSLADYKE